MKKRFQILSLDGGGIKGMFSAAVLAAIEDDLKVNIVDHFDLITGTSTGGIIAIGLGMGLKPKEIVEFYIDKGPKIFSKNVFTQSISHWLFSKYSQNDFVEALQSVDIFNKHFGDSTKRLIIPSYNLGDNDVYIFKTPHHERLKRDYKVPAWQVALATSAAPTYLPVSKHVGSARHIDGGIWANNPIMVGIIEAVSMLNVSVEDIYVLSLGTSEPVVHYPKCLDKGGKIPWLFHIPNLFIHSQSLCANNQAVHLLGSEKVVRVNPKVPDNVFSLDKTERKQELMSKAAHESRIFMPKISDTFISHFADKYEPLFK